MQVTIGAKCWDGMRRKSLIEAPVEVEALNPVDINVWNDVIRTGKRLNNMEIVGTGLIAFLAPHVINAFKPVKAYAASVHADAVMAMANAPEAVPVMSDATKTKILHAFDPLITMIQSLSYPIAGVMIAGGCLFIMTGNRERGMQMLQNAALGYILVQLSPMLLELLVGIGQSV